MRKPHVNFLVYVPCLVDSDQIARARAAARKSRPSKQPLFTIAPRPLVPGSSHLAADPHEKSISGWAVEQCRGPSTERSRFGGRVGSAFQAISGPPSRRLSVVFIDPILVLRGGEHHKDATPIGRDKSRRSCFSVSRF